MYGHASSTFTQLLKNIFIPISKVSFYFRYLLTDFRVRSAEAERNNETCPNRCELCVNWAVFAYWQLFLCKLVEKKFRWMIKIHSLACILIGCNIVLRSTIYAETVRWKLNTNFTKKQPNSISAFACIGRMKMFRNLSLLIRLL